jgi:synaptojanin
MAIQGYVGIFAMALPAPPTDGSPVVSTLSLISRLGWKRAGTRFNTRGVDDDGNCANFVEVRSFVLISLPHSEDVYQTETIFSTDQHCVSYVQVRGSIPCMSSYPNALDTKDFKRNVTCQYSGNSRASKLLVNAYK